MNCLKDYIGIYGCRVASPESGLFINELPGVSLQSIDRIADSDQQTYLNVWDDVQQRAIRKLHADIAAAFAHRYRIKTITDSVQLPKTADTTNITVAADELRGITIEVAGAGSATQSSGLQVIHVQRLEAYFSTPADVTFKVIDLDTQSEIDTFEKSVTEGWNLIAVNRDFTEPRIFIGYDATAVESVSLELPVQYECTCHIIRDWGYDCCQGNIKGAVYYLVQREAVQGRDSYGVSAVVGVQCRYDALVCNNKAVFAHALWYLLGAELMTERIYSDRLNRYTTADRNRALELRKEFRDDYVHSMEMAVSGISLNQFDCCIECDAPLQYEESSL